MTPKMLAQIAELYRRESRDATRARRSDATYLDKCRARIEQMVERSGFVGDPFEAESKVPARSSVAGLVATGSRVFEPTVIPWRFRS